MDTCEFILHANKRGTPFISLTTQDMMGNVTSIVKFLEEKHKEEKRRCILWTPLSIAPLNKGGEESLLHMQEKRSPELAKKPLSLVELIRLSRYSYIGTIIFVLNSHYYLSSCEAPLSTAILEARGELKTNLSTIVFLSPDISLPLELRGEIIPYDIPLPSDGEIRTLIEQQYALLSSSVEKKTNVPLPPLSQESLKKFTVFLRGLPPFSIENTFALSTTREGVEEESLFKQKQEMLKQTKGITLSSPIFAFNDLAGLDGIKERFKRIIQGKIAPQFIAFVDEIGDMFSGGDGDNTGTRQYMRGKFLEEMERQKTMGVLLTGVQGTGKSSFPEALAGEFNLPFIRIDLGALFESKLGNSEANIRTLFKTLEGLSGGEPYLLVGSTNSLVNIRPQERRRFTLGVYHFDLPTQEELVPIWDIQLKKFELKEEPLKEANLTGAEIRNMCQEAFMTGCSLKEARSLTVPYYVANMDKIRGLRTVAHNNYLNPTTGKVFSIDEKSTNNGERLFDV